MRTLTGYTEVIMSRRRKFTPASVPDSPHVFGYYMADQGKKKHEIVYSMEKARLRNL